jgi:predicted amidohydrolase
VAATTVDAALDFMEPRSAGGNRRSEEVQTVAVVQAGTVLGDTPATLAKLARLAREAKDKGATFAVFPEAFIGGYPKGLTFGTTVGNRTAAGRSLFQEYADGAIAVPGPATSAMGDIARDFIARPQWTIGMYGFLRSVTSPERGVVTC